LVLSPTRSGISGIALLKRDSQADPDSRQCAELSRADPPMDGQDATASGDKPENARSPGPLARNRTASGLHDTEAERESLVSELLIPNGVGVFIEPAECCRPTSRCFPLGGVWPNRQLGIPPWPFGRRELVARVPDLTHRISRQGAPPFGTASHRFDTGR